MRALAREPRLRDAFGGSIKLGAGFAPTIVEFDRWIAGLAEQTNFPPLDRKASSAMPLADLLALISGQLTHHARGVERELLRKSIEETLYIAAGKEMELSGHSAHRRLTSWIRSRSHSELIERFLAIHVLNAIWYRVGDIFRRSALTVGGHEAMLRRLDRGCNLVSSSAWQSQGARPGLSLATAEVMVTVMEAGLLML